MNPFAGDSVLVRSPATGELLHELPATTATEMDALVGAAHVAQRAWVRMNPEDRTVALWRLGELLAEHHEELARMDSLETGKVITESIAEARRGARHFRYWAGQVERASGEVLSDVAHRHSYATRVPLGVMGVIIPWNAPTHALAARVAPPLASGNAVVAKPSELSPSSALRLRDLGLEAGLPEGLLSVVIGGAGLGAQLVEHPGVGGVSFTGSVAVGKAVGAAAGRLVKSVTLELGGKSPIIVFDDADLERAVEAAAGGILYNSGQICAASSRLIVHRGVSQDFARMVSARLVQQAPGDPMKASTRLGPLISDAQGERVRGMIEHAVAGGAVALTGGSQPPQLASGLRPDAFVLPTLLTGVRSGMPAVAEEVFGPVLCLQEFGDEDEALWMANDSPLGLSSYIWTRDLGRAMRMARAIEAGVVHVNSPLIVDSQLPMGGHKESGVGGAYGVDAINGCTQWKRATFDFS